MKILHLACLNNDPEIQPNMGPKCNPVGGEPHILKAIVRAVILTPRLKLSQSKILELDFFQRCEPKV